MDNCKQKRNTHKAASHKSEITFISTEGLEGDWRLSCVKNSRKINIFLAVSMTCLFYG